MPDVVEEFLQLIGKGAQGECAACLAGHVGELAKEDGARGGESLEAAHVSVQDLGGMVADEGAGLLRYQVNRVQGESALEEEAVLVAGYAIHQSEREGVMEE